jgi:hypothetical protein
MTPKTIMLPEGVDISLAEQKRIEDGLKALAKDPHAPRQLSIEVTLHVHNEFPKLLYKGEGKKLETRSVANESEEDAAAAEGFGPYDHEAATTEA